MTHGHLWDRLCEAKERLDPVQSKYRIMFENPDDLDAPAAIMCPDPNWMACALAGDILPPIETYNGMPWFQMVNLKSIHMLNPLAP